MKIASSRNFLVFIVMLVSAGLSGSVYKSYRVLLEPILYFFFILSICVRHLGGFEALYEDSDVETYLQHGPSHQVWSWIDQHKAL